MLTEADIEQIFADNSQYVFNLCSSFTYFENLQDIEDVVQEVFIVLYTKRESLNKDGIRAWLYKTADFKVKEYLRRKYTKEIPISDEDIEIQNTKGFQYSPDAYIPVSPELIEESKQKVLNRLNEREHIIYTYIYEEELPYKEIAKRLGISVNTVKVYALRIRQKVNIFARQVY